MSKVWFFYVEDVPDGRLNVVQAKPAMHIVGSEIIGPFKDDVNERTRVVEHDFRPVEISGDIRLTGGIVWLRRDGTVRTGRPCMRTGMYRSECSHEVSMVISEEEEMLQCHEGGGHDTVWVLIDILD